MKLLVLFCFLILKEVFPIRKGFPNSVIFLIWEDGLGGNFPNCFVTKLYLPIYVGELHSYLWENVVAPKSVH